MFCSLGGVSTQQQGAHHPALALSTGDHRPGALAAPRVPPSTSPFAHCLLLPSKAAPGAAPSQLPRAPKRTRHIICHAHLCGSDPRRHPALPRVLPWDKAELGGEGREERKEIHKVITPQHIRNTRSLLKCAVYGSVFPDLNLT